MLNLQPYSKRVLKSCVFLNTIFELSCVFKTREKGAVLPSRGREDGTFSCCLAG